MPFNDSSTCNKIKPENVAQSNNLYGNNIITCQNLTSSIPTHMNQNVTKTNVKCQKLAFSSYLYPLFKSQYFKSQLPSN